MGTRCLSPLGPMHCTVTDAVHLPYLVSEVLGVRAGPALLESLLVGPYAACSLQHSLWACVGGRHLDEQGAGAP